MNTRIAGGTLMAFELAEAARFTAVPLFRCAAARIQIRPRRAHHRPDRPGSMVKLTVAGARPLCAVTTSAAVPLGIVVGTAKINLPPPMLLIFTACETTPWWQSSSARNTVDVSGIRMGNVYSVESGRYVMPDVEIANASALGRRDYHLAHDALGQVDAGS